MDFGGTDVFAGIALAQVIAEILDGDWFSKRGCMDRLVLGDSGQGSF